MISNVLLRVKKLASQLKKLVCILSTMDLKIILALKHGVAASIEHIPVLQNISCSTVIDIGANRGQFALAARSCFPDATIESFEPLSEPRELYMKVFSKDHHVNLHPYAIGEEKRDMEIHISQKDDSSSLLPIAKAQTDLFPGTAEKELRKVQVIPLNEVINSDEIGAPALLKLDVQGYELSALRGCVSLLNKFMYIYVECSFIELYEGQSLAGEVIEYLAEKQFRLTGVYNMYYNDEGRAIQADFMFERKT